jgi:hypothetical protein
MPDHSHRALLRAALREVGYDAVGTRTLETALRVNTVEADRGAVRLIIVDQSALGGDDGEHLDRLLARHGAPATLLLARATIGTPKGAWQRVLRRPLSVADAVTATEVLLPLPAQGRHPLD